MVIINLLYDLVIAAICLGSGVYMLRFYQGKIEVPEDQNRIRKLRVKKYGTIIKTCIVIVFISGAYFLIVFFGNLLRLL